MLDQCHNVEEKVPAELRSVMNVQEATAKALLVDREALRSAQAEGDVMAANAALVDAFSSDAIPMHLLTREAFAVYEEHLRGPGSVIAVHISNQTLDLRPARPQGGRYRLRRRLGPLCICATK